MSHTSSHIAKNKQPTTPTIEQIHISYPPRVPHLPPFPHDPNSSLVRPPSPPSPTPSLARHATPRKRPSHPRNHVHACTTTAPPNTRPVAGILTGPDPQAWTTGGCSRGLAVEQPYRNEKSPCSSIITMRWATLTNKSVVIAF